MLEGLKGCEPSTKRLTTHKDEENKEDMIICKLVGSKC